MTNYDALYNKLLREIIETGNVKEARSGKVRSIFGVCMEFDLSEGLPILTTKRVYYKGIIHELLWFLKGDTNIKYLVENNVHIWDDDAYRWFCSFYDEIPMSKEEFLDNVLKSRQTWVKDKKINIFKRYIFGDLGDIYGKSWRSFGVNGVDQIKNIINTLKTDPDNRRMLCVAFNPDVADNVALPPCHTMFQFYTRKLDNGRRELSCMFNMRSNDICCGNPYNITQYAILTYIIANICDMEVGKLLYVGGDVHIYENHIEGAMEQLSRSGSDIQPKLLIKRKLDDIDDLKYDDFEIVDYHPDKPIKYELNVGM